MRAAYCQFTHNAFTEFEAKFPFCPPKRHFRGSTHLPTDKRPPFMKILIIGGGFENKGAEAMVRTVEAQLSSRLGNVSFVLPRETRMPEGFFASPAENLRLLSDDISRVEKLRIVKRRLLARPIYCVRDAIHRDWTMYAARVEKVDAIIDIAGFAYGDAWGTSRAMRAQNHICAANNGGIPYIFMPQAWGPFELAEYRPVFQRLCSEATGFYARDASSREYLSQLLSKETDAIPIAPDIAFRFRGASRQKGRKILEELGLPLSANELVGIAPNQRVYERTDGTGLENSYMQSLCEICAEFRRRNVSVIIVPHEIAAGNDVNRDDRELGRLIAGHFRDEHIIAMTDRYTAEEVKGVIANFGLLLGSRYHALVAALSQGIPVAAIGWSHKYVELLQMFGLDQFVIELQKIGEFCPRQLVDDLSDDRLALGTQVVRHLQTVHADVDRTFDEVSAVVREAVLKRH